MTIERYQKIQRVLHKRQTDLTILAENIYKPHNLSAILRSCDAVGISTVHAVNPTGGVPTYNETSASANKWVELEVHADIDKALNHLYDRHSQDLQILAAHLSPKATNYIDVDYTRPTCIVMGNEKDGVSAEIAARADQHIIVPMVGMVQSLNVSVATAVILFEAQRQRQRKGFYDKPQLEPVAIAQQTFRWLHPVYAEHLNASNLPYPALDETGDIIYEVTEAEN